MPSEQERTGSEPNAAEERDSAERRARDARTRAAIEAYRRTLRNEASRGTGSDPGSGGGGPAGARTAEEAQLLAERPPHWQTKPR